MRIVTYVTCDCDLMCLSLLMSGLVFYGVLWLFL